MVLQFPCLVSGFETMKDRKEEEIRMAHGVGGLAKRTVMGV